MKKYLVLYIACLMTLSTLSVQAGNPDRIGEAGAYELLINGWARSAGLFGMNSATVSGVEAMRINPAGLAGIQGTEINISYSSWLTGADVNIYKAGFGQRLGEENIIALSVMSLDFGEINRTTVNLPEPVLGTFSPTFINIGIGYSRIFSNSITGGVTLRVVNESIEDIGATGFAVDLGLQYVTGPKENIHFGVSMRNVGTPMRYRGDGFTFRGEAPDNDFNMSLSQRTEKFELPSLLNIGIGYDFYMGPVDSDEEDAKNDHRLTINANFTSKSVGKDFIGAGLEYAYREMFMARVGYRYEEGITNETDRETAHTGLAAGLSFDVPISKGDNGSRLGIDYAYRPTYVWNGTHTAGIRLTL
ncbi:MAG: PorV/PorQ family protein [Chitinophagales bacterium]|nr:PorV/PorQ family protein [Chitinophagales bacterium]